MGHTSELFFNDYLQLYNQKFLFYEHVILEKTLKMSFNFSLSNFDGSVVAQRLVRLPLMLEVRGLIPNCGKGKILVSIHAFHSVIFRDDTK